MAPPLGTNPFDDSDDDEGGGGGGVRVTPNSTNPFDDDDGDDDGVGVGVGMDQNNAGAVGGVSNPTGQGFRMASGRGGSKGGPGLLLQDNLGMDDEDAKEGEDMDDDLPVEASWQYLGDLPYRRVSLYSNVGWNEQEGIVNEGLSAFPESYVNAKRQSNNLDARDLRELLSTTTTTKVAGCPHGGPVAAATLPVLGGAMPHTELRIMTNSGRLLSSVVVPPKELARQYSAADIMMIGFTERTVLMVVLRDSLCLTYDLQGKAILPPFHILQDGTDHDLLHASIYEGGVAVLSTKMKSAVVEMLDEHDDPSYANSSHLTARRILPSLDSVADRAVGEMLGSGDHQPPHYALVTPIPTDTYAQ